MSASSPLLSSPRSSALKLLNSFSFGGSPVDKISFIKNNKSGLEYTCLYGNKWSKRITYNPYVNIGQTITIGNTATREKITPEEKAFIRQVKLEAYNNARNVDELARQEFTAEAPDWACTISRDPLKKTYTRHTPESMRQAKPAPKAANARYSAASSTTTMSRSPSYEHAFTSRNGKQIETILKGRKLLRRIRPNPEGSWSGWEVKNLTQAEQNCLAYYDRLREKRQEAEEIAEQQLQLLLTQDNFAGSRGSPKSNLFENSPKSASTKKTQHHTDALGHESTVIYANGKRMETVLEYDAAGGTLWRRTNGGSWGKKNLTKSELEPFRSRDALRQNENDPTIKRKTQQLKEYFLQTKDGFFPYTGSPSSPLLKNGFHPVASTWNTAEQTVEYQKKMQGILKPNLVNFIFEKTEQGEKLEGIYGDKYMLRQTNQKGITEYHLGANQDDNDKKILDYLQQEILSGHPTHSRLPMICHGSECLTTDFVKNTMETVSELREFTCELFSRPGTSNLSKTYKHLDKSRKPIDFRLPPRLGRNGKPDLSRFLKTDPPRGQLIGTSSKESGEVRMPSRRGPNR